MILPEPLCFVDCDIDADCAAQVREGLVETFARQFLNPESDLAAFDDVMQTAQTFFWPMNAI